jgi:GntR family transcriptional regulator
VVSNWYCNRVNPVLVDEFRRLGRSRAHPLAYLRLRDALRHSVERGAFAPGQPLPSERDLASALKLSRVTVRRAIANLVDDGVLLQRHGAGTFVVERIVKSVSRLTSFTEDLRARGLDPSSTFFERSVGTVTPQEAMALDLSPGARVVRLHRLRYGDGTALALEHTIVPHDVLGDPAAVRDSLYEALEPLGMRPTRALQRLRAVALEAEPARLLGLPTGSAALLIERRAFAASGRVVEFTRSFYRGDAYDFVAELQ